MRGLTLHQPWASLVAFEEKLIETRPFNWSYRGPLAIHAAKGTDPAVVEAYCRREPFRSTLQLHGIYSEADLPRGAIISVHDLVDVFEFDEHTADVYRVTDNLLVAGGHSLSLTEREVDFGDFRAGRFGYALANCRRLNEPVPARGMQGLWLVPPEIQAAISTCLSTSTPAGVGGREA